jgi:NAD(P) transhydrogenase subunit alpha
MKIGIPRETYDGERRVAATPDSVRTLLERGFEVAIERGAGAEADFTDEAYEAAGATLTDATAIWSESDVVMKVRPPSVEEANGLREGATLLAFIQAGDNEDVVAALMERKATVLAMEAMPRISRAQKMDALSSMANIAGYRAVIEAANRFGSFFTGQFTAAGKVPPAKVLVIGAGVAGLAAIAAARGLGAVVRAFDTRPAVKEQVGSLGAQFLELDFEESGDGGGGYAKVMSKEFIEAEHALFREQAKEVDIVVTTALIPNKPAPKLWLADMVELMKPGSVVVDLAAERGGNCELTQPNEVVREHGVTIIGYTDLTSRLPTTASQLYSRNLLHLLDDIGKPDTWNWDLEDEIIRGATLVHQGERLPPPEPKKLDAAADPKASAKAAGGPAAAEKPMARPIESVATRDLPMHKDDDSPRASYVFEAVALALAGLWLWLKLGTGDDPSADASGTQAFLQHLTVFVLACFVGWQVIWNVSPALHTPLMSVTNAISGIILVGGMLQLFSDNSLAALVLGAAAILFATINVAGGFLVTQRMLKMFRK